MPTGGVDASEDSLTAWFRAGAACVGIGSELVRKEWVAAGDWETISNQVRQVLLWIQDARGLNKGRS
jgi:2-dehydro-3-deoxyphosphogluconate aldolase/(4S)-4-hydroxy-2-oxoglutarate aldolase